MSEPNTFTFEMSQGTYASVVVDGNQAAISMSVDLQWLAKHQDEWPRLMATLATKMLEENKPRLRVVK